jgi:hypothetical protein
MSRQAVPGDWNYACSLDDPARAVYGSQSDAGVVGEPITALIPRGDQHMLIGCTNSLWAMRGDPTYGGRIDCLSRTIGTLSGSSWCSGPAGGTVFLSRDGLYYMQPGAVSRPESVSREKVPDELLGIDATANTIAMVPDTQERGVHIYVTPTTAADGDHWFVDWTNRGFWKDTYQETHQPSAVCTYAKDQSEPKIVILGSKDGYLREYDETVATDINANGSTSNVDSYVLIGPFRLGDEYHDGMLTEITGILDQQSGAVTWSVLVGDTAEEAVGASAFAAGTWNAGRSTATYPRARGAAAVVKVSGATRWAMESIVAVVQQLGKQRM